MDDETIIRLYWQRDENAIAATDTKYGSYCRSIAFNITGDLRDSEECTNDTYLRTWNAIPPTKPLSLCAFLGRIVRNLSLDRLRRKNAQKSPAYDTTPLHELVDCIPASDDMQNAVDDLLLRELINRFLASLPEETRNMFLRRYFYFSPLKDIARDFGMTESKVKMKMLRTRNALREALEKEGYNV
ncbi:MAG: RNA polymerase sigma factor [Clostridia bacterium]|nr:RNA polymerase sigma factor [Clostridia bacterium]